MSFAYVTANLKNCLLAVFQAYEFHSGDYAFSQESIAALDWQIPMGSLPAIFRPDLLSFQHQPQFLTPDPIKTAYFQQLLQPSKKTLTIGIAWRSSLLSLERRALYPYLDFWRELFRSTPELPGLIYSTGMSIRNSLMRKSDSASISSTSRMSTTSTI